MAWRIPTFDEAIKDKELCSYILSAALDFLGYSYDAIKERQRFYEQMSQWMSRANEQGFVTFHIVGSKGEGLTKYFENDHDCMYSYYQMVCVDDANDVAFYGPLERLFVVQLLADKNGVLPGYAKLKVPAGELWKCKRFLDGCFSNRSGDVYLSSVLFNHKPNVRQECDCSRNGPAHTRLSVSLDRLGMECSIDGVTAFPYKCKKLMQEWKARPRYRGWPSEEQIQEVSQLDWHVVPVGSTKEDEGVHERRICFTLGEKYLIKTFNHAQLQLVVLLKYVSARILKSVCPAMSSYIMKNIVLWMAELLPRKVFRIQNLTRLLMLSLATLRRAVDRVSLKNYMIPARNMFLGKISRDEREILMAHLDSFLLEGPSFLLQDARLSRLSGAMYQVFKDPEGAERRQHIYDVGEAKYLKWNTFVLRSCKTIIDTYFNEIERHPDELAFVLNKLPEILEKLNQAV